MLVSMPPLKSLKQEKFCFNVIKTGNGTQSAKDAGFGVAGARVTACRLLTKPNIKARLAELRGETHSNQVMDVIERKERLSEIAREGNIKQTDPVRAIQELNRMSGDYAPVEVRSFVIIVSSDRAKELTERVGERLIEEVNDGAERV